MKDLEKIWVAFLSKLEKIFSQQIYDTWFVPLKPAKIKNDIFFIEAPSPFFVDWLKKHYLSFMETSLQETDPSLLKIDFLFNEAQTKKTQQPDIPTPPLKKDLLDLSAEANLNPKYSFTNFVVGSSNRFAHAACMAVAESPAKAYNPLFIYGGVGLGKTHLMHSIGQHILSKTAKKKVIYISSEKFMNQLIDSIQKRKTVQFRNKYRSVDVLLLDDIQFLSGKEQTQEELFHTFNTLYDAHKQIVLASDRPPKEIPNLEERLVSRFEWGLVADLQFPDTETRIAILKKKAELSNLTIPSDILFFLAEKIKTNIRKLEGALIRVASYASLTGSPLTIKLAEDVLQDLILVNDEATITISSIQEVAAEHFGIAVADIKSKKRSKAVVIPRQIAMFLSRELTPFSLSDIGHAFGGKDHTTIIHGIKKIEEQLKTDDTLKQKIHIIKKKITK